jgi:3-isopropylmalate/(R)-2-methylmalate dehydratase small subunit
MVIASGFARIFRQNMYNCGLIAAELPPEKVDFLFRNFAGRETTLGVDLSGGPASPASGTGSLCFKTAGMEETFPFVLKDFERALVEAGGWVEYADAHY